MPITPTTIDGAKKAPSITLSGGDLVATGGSGQGYALSVFGVSSGKASFEVTPAGLNGGTTMWIGVSNLPTLPLADGPDEWAGAAASKRAGAYLNSGPIWSGGSPDHSYDAICTATNGVAKRIEIDRDAGSWWIMDATSRSGAYPLPAGAIYAALGFEGGTAGKSLTLNAGQSAWSITPTAGFEAGLGASGGGVSVVGAANGLGAASGAIRLVKGLVGASASPSMATGALALAWNIAGAAAGGCVAAGTWSASGPMPLAGVAQGVAFAVGERRFVGGDPWTRTTTVPEAWTRAAAAPEVWTRISAEEAIDG